MSDKHSDCHTSYAKPCGIEGEVEIGDSFCIRYVGYVCAAWNSDRRSGRVRHFWAGFFSILQ